MSSSTCPPPSTGRSAFRLMANARKNGRKRGTEPSNIDSEFAFRTPRPESIVHVLIDALPSSEQPSRQDPRELLTDSLNRTALMASVVAQNTKDGEIFRRVATVLIAVSGALRRNPELLRPLSVRAS